MKNNNLVRQMTNQMDFTVIEKFIATNTNNRLTIIISTNNPINYNKHILLIEEN